MLYVYLFIECVYNLHYGKHSRKFATRLNLHLERENSRINNFMTLFPEKII